MMKIALGVGILAGISAVTIPCATAQSKQSQEGTILGVQKRDVAMPPVRAGADTVRTPLQSNNYVPVRISKNVMYLDFPGYTVKMRIVHHKVSETACQ